MTVPRSPSAAVPSMPLPTVASEDVTVIAAQGGGSGTSGSGTSGTSGGFAMENPTVIDDVAFDIAEELPSVYLKGCAEEHSMPSLVGIGCRADGVSSRLSHHLDDGAVPADVLKTRKRFMHQYALVVKKIQALQAIKTKSKLNASFTPARLKEAKKTEKQMRKLRSSILRKDLPLLRRAASGSSHMCSFSRPLCREEMEKHIDMIVELQAWIEEDVVLDLNYDDDAIAVDITVDASRQPSRVEEDEEEEATESPAAAAAAAVAASGVAAAAFLDESAAELDASLNDSIVRTPREPKIYARRVAAQKERKEAVQRREELRRQGTPGATHGQGGDSGSSWASSCAPQPAASTDGDIGGGGSDEGDLRASTASVGSGSAQGNGGFALRGSPPVGECSSAPGSPEGRCLPDEADEGVQGNHEEEGEAEETPVEEEEAEQAPVEEGEGPAGGAEQGPSEAAEEALRQQIDDTVALEAAQRAEALEEAKRDSQRLRSELKKKQQAMQSRQSARWDKAEGGGETPRCVRRLQQFNDDPQSFVDMIYAEYPPRDGKQKYDRGNLKKTVQRAISHYHPDKQDEDAHGSEWLVMCDEICKELTRIYVKL